ncbi:nucleoside-diphosphate-sugar epimerase [Sphingomonas zeicaulis]|uniref:NAD-dependent epimerase/dehydratase family protein n=1 Tax=Sphingomonas zeicaulis TaxID=1632740 RepID=UPI003D1DC340
MRVLLTGSSGRLGRVLAPRLIAAGHHVIGLDVVPGHHTAALGSVADRAFVDRLFGDHGIEAVIHAGGLHQPDMARLPRSAFVETNISGTLNLIEAAALAGHDRFLFTSTTSLMISATIHQGAGGTAAWIDEDLAPLVPRNIYGVTKLAAEHLCRLAHLDHGMGVVVLRTGRFFAESAKIDGIGAENRMANELLHRRLTVEDAAEAHLVALERAPSLGFETLILSAPTPFVREDCAELMTDAAALIAHRFPDAAALYAARDWVLPRAIDRVYSAARAEAVLGFRCRTDFRALLDAMAAGAPLPFAAGEAVQHRQLEPC